MTKSQGGTEMADELNRQTIETIKPNVSLEQLYNTMSGEADGLYRQIITICTVFLGGTLAYFDKLFVGNVRWSIVFLFGAWLALTYPLAVLVRVRWQNVEAHRHALEFFKTHDNKEYDKAVEIPRRGRRRTNCAICSMIIGLLLIAIFAGINIIFKFKGGQ